ncbi:MAG: lipid A biosynthesis acyltransferase [Gammaproteobacteria bacterium]|nr:lysophospholipid acyltransferase family protein [Gammaproteobacteria bacterium]PCH62574.1 MAG: lipid A biosynthesis acyltransferase [Gammaproteobacteria bacterium]PCH64534.1 MAG: lipid A biosynthesis acyltransferase [Gammaproteobacteria bacterium]
MRSILTKIFIQLIALLPLGVAHSVGKFIGLCLYRLPNRLRHTTQINIDLCWPTLESAEKTTLIKQSLIQTGMSIMEIGAMLCWPKQRLLGLIDSIEGEQHLQQAITQEHGMILLTPHLGCWEIAGLYIGSRYPATILYKPPKIKTLTAWLIKARQRTGANLVATDELGARQLLKSLKQKKEVIALLPDQEPPIGNGIFVPFFGIEANTMTLAVKLAKKTGAPIVFGFAERLAEGQGYKLFALAAEEEIYSSDINIAVTSMNRSIEQCIRKAPEQYQWSYKRFRRRPEGAKNPYNH